MKRKGTASDGESQSLSSPNLKSTPPLTQAPKKKNKGKMCDNEDRPMFRGSFDQYDVGSPAPSQNRGTPRSAVAGVMDVISKSILEIKESLTARECVWLVDYVLDDGNRKLKSLAFAHFPAEIRILYVREKCRASKDG